MNILVVSIQRFVDDHFPGFVQCVVADADGFEHQFFEKVPVVTSANLSSRSVYPQSGHIACTFEAEWIDDRGRKLARVSTVEPWGVESLTGETNFTVLREQIVCG